MKNQDETIASEITAEVDDDNQKIQEKLILSSNEDNILNAQDNGNFMEFQEGGNTSEVLSDTSQNTLNNNEKSINGNKIGEEFYNSVKPTFKISVPNEVYENSRVTITFTSSDNVNGWVYLRLDNGEDNNQFEIKNGKGSGNIKIPFVKSIDYEFLSSNESVNDVTGSFNINVIKPATVIKASDFKVNYPSKTKYKVRILNEKGVSIGAGKKVTFTLYNNNGKKVATKTVNTDKNGYAKVYFNVAPSYYHNYHEHYKIKIKCGSKTVTKKYTVKGIDIQFKKFNKKNKLAKDYYKLIWGFNKKISISFVLKKADGSYLKGKTIKFKFKGKTYTAKTNKKGVVIFSLKKKLLKGAYVGNGENRFKISYLKDVYKGFFSFYNKKLFNTESYGYKYYIDTGGGALQPSKYY